MACRVGLADDTTSLTDHSASSTVVVVVVVVGAVERLEQLISIVEQLGLGR